MKKKCSFLLLELMIAISLIALVAVPFVRSPMYILKGEIVDLQEIELKREALLTFMEVQEKLHSKEITWDQLELKDELKLPEKILSLDLGTCGKSSWKQTVSILTQLEKKEEKTGELNRLVEVRVAYTPQGKRESLIFQLFQHW